MRGSLLSVFFLVVLFLVGMVLYKNFSSTNSLLPNYKKVQNNSLNSPSVSSQLSNQITLVIKSPKNRETIEGAKVTVSGKTVPNAEVFVNDLETKADSKGFFSVTITLDPGENVINVTANDEFGNYSEKELTVISNQ